MFVQLETHLIRSYVELSKLIDQQFPSVRIYTLNNHFSSWSQNPKTRFQTPKPERSSTGCRKTRNSEGKRPTNLACSMIFEPPTIPCHPNLPFSQFHIKELEVHSSSLTVRPEKVTFPKKKGNYRLPVPSFFKGGMFNFRGSTLSGYVRMTCVFRNPKKKDSLALPRGRSEYTSSHTLPASQAPLAAKRWNGDRFASPIHDLHSFKIDSNHNLFCFRELINKMPDFAGGPWFHSFLPKSSRFSKLHHFCHGRMKPSPFHHRE